MFDPKTFLFKLGEFFFKPRLTIWDRYPVGTRVIFTSGGWKGRLATVTEHYITVTEGLKALSLRVDNITHREYSVTEKNCIIKRAPD